MFRYFKHTEAAGLPSIENCEGRGVGQNLVLLQRWASASAQPKGLSTPGYYAVEYLLRADLFSNTGPRPPGSGTECYSELIIDVSLHDWFLTSYRWPISGDFLMR